jgi:hypothetical protein
MIYIILALLLTHLLTFLLGMWVTVGVYEQERCNIYKDTNKKTKKRK